MFTFYATSLAFLFTQSQTSFMNHQDIPSQTGFTDEVAAQTTKI